MKNKFLGVVGLLLFAIIPLFGVRAETSGYFTADDNVNLEESVEHSKFVAGNNINLRGNISGLNFVAGNSLNVSATSEYGFMAGESLDINGKVEKDLFIAGNNITLEKDASVGRDLYAAGNNVKVKSNILGNAFIGASNVVLDNAVINGDLNLEASNIEIIGNVVINGTLYVNEDANINNEISLSVNKKETYKNPSVNVDVNFTTTIYDKLISILSVIFTGVILALLFPKVFKSIDKELDAGKVLKNICIGFVSLIGIPFIAILLLCTIVGIRLSFIGIMLYVIAILLATIMASYVIGNLILTKLMKGEENTYLSIVIGVVVVKIVEMIPYIGGLVVVLVFLMGLGIIFDLFKKVRN